MQCSTLICRANAEEYEWNNMDCKEFEKMIPDFIDGKMDYLTLKSFCEHEDECAYCKEELTIKILVTEGIQRLEDGSAFDLQAEMRRRMDDAKRKIRSNGDMIRVGVTLEVIALCMMAVVIIGIML